MLSRPLHECKEAQVVAEVACEQEVSADILFGYLANAFS